MALLRINTEGSAIECLEQTAPRIVDDHQRLSALDDYVDGDFESWFDFGGDGATGGVAAGNGTSLQSIVNSVLYRPVAGIPNRQAKMRDKLHENDAVPNGGQTRIVADDGRNILALTSVLERYNIGVHPADYDRDAIDMIQIAAAPPARTRENRT
jgi:hypothetical protein